MTSFFIKHPVIAFILNAMLVIVGLICANSIPVQEYPSIKVPAFQVYTHYHNASAELVEASITEILEDSLAGLEGLDYIDSSSMQGVSRITLMFLEGTSIDKALISIREAINLAKSNLPKEVDEPVVERTSQQGLPFMAISLSGDMSPGELNHYANLQLKNAFRSLKGVSFAQIWGQPYVMSVILDPKKLYTFGINADEISSKLAHSNMSFPVGRYRKEIPTTLDLTLKDQQDFENLYIKDFNKNPIYLKYVADVALKTDDTMNRVRVNGKPGLLIAISRANDANPLQVSDLVHAQVKKLHLPDGVNVEVVLDQADFIRASLSSIKNSIMEAIVLVLIIVFLFLRNIKATLIPLLTVPISLIGSIIFMKLFGFSLNTLTLLAMVLAIGLVVDDAIVVLENISRHLEKGESPLNAALKGAREIGFAIVAMTLTLASVYAPIIFIQGAIGQLFIEFAVALAGSVLISGVVALTLSPLMCAHLLTHETNRLWPQIDEGFKKLEDLYLKVLNYALTHTKTVLGFCFCVIFAVVGLFKVIPQELAPKEDRNLVGIFLPTIPGKDLNTLDSYTKILEKTLKDVPESASYLTFMGNWGGNVVLNLKPHNERNISAADLVNHLKPTADGLPSADAFAWSFDSGLPGMDNMQSSSVSLSISTIGSYRDLYKQIEKLMKAIENSGVFQSVRHDLSLDTPGYKIEVDHNAVAKLDLSASQISELIEIFFSGKKNLTFQKDSVRYPISLEGMTKPWTLDELYLTTAQGKRVSLGTLAELKSSASPQELIHHNQMRTATLSVDTKAEQSLKEAMNILWKFATKELDPDLHKEWSGAAKLQAKSAMSMIFLFAMALIFIYAILAAQFENFLDPFIIMLTVPLACFGALLTAWLFGQTLNIYTQIGLVTLIGLITKHGILIVEFANQLKAQGNTTRDAIKESARLRLRPILMTTGAMVFGSLPLILSSGAGIEARRAIGSILLGGLTLGTLFTLLILPKLYQFVKR